MKQLKKILLVWVTLSLVAAGLFSTGWAAGDNSLGRNDPVAHEFYIWDLLFARPIGIIAGVFGTAVFVVSLPFTIPSGGVRDAADIFIVKPFQFSFVRQFPDEDI